MSKLSREDFMNRVKDFIGERDDDEALSFIEDCNDTITEDKNDWKAKYEAEVKAKEELDKSWRTKYKERFYSSDTNTHKDNDKDNDIDSLLDTRTEEQKQAEAITIDDLFTTKGE